MADTEGRADPTGRRIDEEHGDRLRHLKDAVAQVFPTALLAAYFAWLWRGERALRTNEALLADFSPYATAARRWTEGPWPLWREHAELGRPWLADPAQAAAYPPTLALAAVFRPDVAHDLAVFVHLWLLGLFAYLLLRAYGLHRATAVAGAMLAQYGPLPAALVQDLEGLQTIPWTVAALWAAERSVQSPRMRWPVAGAAAVALSFLAGAPDLALAGLVLVATVLLVRTALERDRWRRALAALATIAGGGLGLGAFQWIPALALDPSAIFGALGATSAPTLPPVSLLPFALALAAVASPRRRTALLWLALAAASGGLVLVGSEPRALAWIASLALALAATLGLEVLREREWNPPDGVMGLLAFGAFVLAAAWRLPRIYGAAYGLGDYAHDVLHDDALDLAVMLAAFIAVVGLPRGKFKGGKFGAAMALVLFVGIARPTYPWYARSGLPERAEAASTTAWGEVAAFVRLRGPWGRVLTDQAPAAALAARGVAAVDGATTDDGARRFPLDLPFAHLVAADGALQVAGVRYVLTAEEPAGAPPFLARARTVAATPAAENDPPGPDAAIPSARLEGVWTDGVHQLREYAGAPPRAFVVGGRRCFRDPASLRRAMRFREFQPTHYVYAVGCRDAPMGAVGATTVLADGPGALDLRVRAPEGGELVVLEGYAPGWDVRVDDARAVPYAAYGSVLGIPLVPGTHEVSLRYRAPGLTAGLALTALTTLGIAAWPAARRWRKKRRGAGAESRTSPLGGSSQE